METKRAKCGKTTKTYKRANKQMKPIQKKLSELQQCDKILEIRRVNELTISRYRQAMRNGDQFPPLVIEKGTNRIVSGNHRYTAYSEEYGDRSVPCVEKAFRDEAELIEEAVRDNSKHGLPLDGVGRKRAALTLSQLGRDAEAIGRLLGCSVKRVEELAGMTVYVRCGGKKEPHSTKRGLEHISGQTVSKSQYDEHKLRDRGVPAWQNARQLVRWIRNGWVDMTDPKNVEAIAELKEVLETI